MKKRKITSHFENASWPDIGTTATASVFGAKIKIISILIVEISWLLQLVKLHEQAILVRTYSYNKNFYAEFWVQCNCNCNSFVCAKKSAESKNWKQWKKKSVSKNKTIYYSTGFKLPWPSTHLIALPAVPGASLGTSQWLYPCNLPKIGTKYLP